MADRAYNELKSKSVHHHCVHFGFDKSISQDSKSIGK